jgi:hypothetical protein
MAVTVAASEKQMRYLRDLVSAAGLDMSKFLIERGISEVKGWPTGETVARLPSKAEASRLIDELVPTRGSYRPRGRRHVRFYRCTHEDYPCCGCER